MDTSTVWTDATSRLQPEFKTWMAIGWGFLWRMIVLSLPFYGLYFVVGLALGIDIKILLQLIGYSEDVIAADNMGFLFLIMLLMALVWGYVYARWMVGLRLGGFRLTLVRPAEESSRTNEEESV